MRWWEGGGLGNGVGCVGSDWGGGGAARRKGRASEPLRELAPLRSGKASQAPPVPHPAREGGSARRASRGPLDVRQRTRQRQPAVGWLRSADIVFFVTSDGLIHGQSLVAYENSGQNAKSSGEVRSRRTNKLQYKHNSIGRGVQTYTSCIASNELKTNISGVTMS